MLSEVRSGVVSAVDEAAYTARVIYDGDELLSGWLKILQAPPRLTVEETPLSYRVEAAPVVGSTALADLHTHGVDIVHTHPAVSERHAHPITVLPWLPTVGQRVLCLRLLGDGGDGYMLGGL